MHAIQRETSPESTVLHVDDAELLERLLGGDESSFAELVRRYHPTLVKVARYYVASATTAEDVAQDTWIAVLKGVDKFEGRSSFKTWLLRICVNRARTSGVKEHRSIPVDPNESGPSVSAHRFDQGGFWSDPPVPFTDAVDSRPRQLGAPEAPFAGAIDESGRAATGRRGRFATWKDYLLRRWPHCSDSAKRTVRVDLAPRPSPCSRDRRRRP